MTAARYLLLALFPALLLAACGDPIGAACHFEGSGFTASDNCRHRCLQYRAVVCPDGTTLKPQICSGRPQCGPGACPAGEVCYHVNDPFEKESYCLPADICGRQSAAGLAAWEQVSLAISRQSIAAWEAKRQARTKLKATAPAQKIPSAHSPANQQ